MLVNVKTNFAGQTQLEVGTPTLRGVLFELSKKGQISFFSGADEEVRSDFKVYLNETEHEELPDGIDTEVKEGDQLEVNLVIMAGG
jgi:hypothetical protein